MCLGGWVGGERERAGVPQLAAAGAGAHLHRRGGGHRGVGVLNAVLDDADRDLLPVKAVLVAVAAVLAVQHLEVLRYRCAGDQSG